MKVFVQNSFFIPIKNLTADKVQEAHEANSFKFYNDVACEKCPYLPDRHCETCDGCQHFLGTTRLSKVVTVGDNAYLSLPIGDYPALKKLFPDDELEMIGKNKVVPIRK